MIISVIASIFYIKKAGNKYHMSVYQIVIALIILFTLVFTDIHHLNYKLVLDKNQSPEIITGEIDLINSVSIPPKFYYLGERVRPKKIEINNQEYYILTIGDFEVGDNVVIEFLPNSLVVMSINYDND